GAPSRSHDHRLVGRRRGRRRRTFLAGGDPPRPYRDGQGGPRRGERDEAAPRRRGAAPARAPGAAGSRGKIAPATAHRAPPSAALIRAKGGSTAPGAWIANGPAAVIFARFARDVARVRERRVTP